MKTSLVLVYALIITTVLLSWTLLRDTEAVPANGPETDNAEAPPMWRPTAEDVLIQKIPGDNSHLLLMAYYSRERFSGPSVAINNGFTMVLKDDGKGDDKLAADGLYTAKIPADLATFRIEALGLTQKMKADVYGPISYLDRQRIIDPDIAESFDMANFEANEPVSVSALTNALSADIKSTTVSATIAATPSLDSIKRKSIFITDLSVVEDSTRTWNFKTQKGNLDGPWTFKTLMRNLASKNTAQVASDAELSEFIKKWLAQFATLQIVNGDSVAARPLVNTILINPWLARSKANGAPEGQLDMRFAPFKLTAITNRFDLRDGEAFGNLGEPCGEARFIFTLVSSIDTIKVDTINLDTNINIHVGDPLKMNVILESRVNKPNSCEDVRGRGNGLTWQIFHFPVPGTTIHFRK